MSFEAGSDTPNYYFLCLVTPDTRVVAGFSELPTDPQRAMTDVAHTAIKNLGIPEVRSPYDLPPEEVVQGFVSWEDYRQHRRLDAFRGLGGSVIIEELTIPCTTPPNQAGHIHDWSSLLGPSSRG